MSFDLGRTLESQGRVLTPSFLDQVLDNWRKIGEAIGSTRKEAHRQAAEISWRNLSSKFFCVAYLYLILQIFLMGIPKSSHMRAYYLSIQLCMFLALIRLTQAKYLLQQCWTSSHPSRFEKYYSREDYGEIGLGISFSPWWKIGVSAASASTLCAGRAATSPSPLFSLQF